MQQTQRNKYALFIQQFQGSFEYTVYVSNAHFNGFTLQKASAWVHLSGWLTGLFSSQRGHINVAQATLKDLTEDCTSCVCFPPAF